MLKIYLQRTALLAVFSLLTLPFLLAETIVVGSTADSGAGSLRAAVADADSGDTIRFNSSILGRIITLSSEIVIDKALRIRGNGIGNTVISGGGTTRVFNVTTGDDVYIGILEIINGATDTNGGAVINPTGLLRLDGVRISGSTAAGTGVGNGGGAVTSSGRLLVTASQFANNSAIGAAGSGGAILSTGGGFAITNTSFTGNTSTRAGGAIEISGDASGSLLSNVTMTGNATGGAPGNGGGLHITGPSSIQVKGGTYINNTATREGGALWNGSGQMIVRGATIDNNTASGPAADDGGGGIFNNGGTLKVFAGTVITNNKADGMAGSGGGIFNSVGGNLQIVRADISDNTANRAGGGIEDISGAGSLFTVGSSTIDDNEVFTSPGNGGGIHIGGDGNLSLFGGTVSGNKAGAEGGGIWNNLGTTVIFGATIAGNEAAGDAANQGGGGLYNNEGGGKIVVKGGSVIRNNSATGASGSGGGILNDDGGSLELLNVRVSNNTANRAGGGIEDASGPGTTVIIAKGTINDNTVFSSPGNGGGIHVGGAGNISFRSGTVTANTAGAEGGGIWIGSGRLDVGQGVSFNDNIALGNDADQGGGALYAAGAGTIRLRNNVLFLRNRATGTSGSGGAILINEGATLTMDRARFDDNSANRAGGAIEDNSGAADGFDDFRVINSTFVNNVVNNSPGNGGAIHITGRGNAFIRGGEFNDNTAGSEGGAVWNSLGTMRLQNASFSDNVASGDGADNGGGAIFNNGGTMRIVGITVSDNLANGTAGSGGGMLTTGGNVTIEGSTFSDNESSRAGGAIEQIDGFFTSSNSTYDGNITGSSPGNGGAFHVTGTSSTILFRGGMIVDNVAANEGGGLWNQRGSTMTVEGVTIDGNSVSGTVEGDAGGGIFNNSGITRVMNSTISDNTVNAPLTSGGGIFNRAGGEFTLMASTVAGNITGGSGGGIANDGMFTILNSTIALNTAAVGGGYAQVPPGASLTITGSILSDNVSSDDNGTDISAPVGTVTSGGFNLIGTDDQDNFDGTADDIEGGDANLDILADNGGVTRTIALLCGSDAINAGDSGDDSGDQNGQLVFNTRDIGAFELQADCPVSPGIAGFGNTISQLEAGLDVYPNPTSEGAVNVRIPTDLEGEVTLRLIDANGSVRATRMTRAGGLIRIPLDGTARGAYTLQVINGETMTSRRIVTMR